MPTWRSTGPRRRARTATRSSGPRWRARCATISRSSSTCARPWPTTSSVSSTSRSTTSTTSRSSASKRCCAGSTRRVGLIQPNEFIPLLESSGRIREVGRWVLGMACQQMAAWHALGSTLGVSVNVSGRQLDDDAIVDRRPRRARDQHARPRRAHHRDHRDRADAQHRRQRPTAHGDQGARRQPRDRRLRHRLLVARVPQAAPDRHDQDRPRVHRRPRRAPRSPTR